MEINTQRNQVPPLAVQDEDDIVVDTRFIHWGYANCCLVISKGKKVKKEKWITYWLELCGSTLRFYKDTSLHVESSLSPPPTSPRFLLEENESKVAFFELGNADVKVLSDSGKVSQSFRRKSKKSVAPSVFRRHLFQLKLRNINSTYIFQAPSHSAMLRWVSKIQESLDSFTKHDEKRDAAERRLKTARDMMERVIKSSTSKELEVLDFDDGSSEMANVNEVQNCNPSLKNLKEKLALMNEQIWQYEMQIIDFLGRGKGAFKRNEFVCTTKQNYFLVPGRTETFIPTGTIVTIFGQLANKRWRCLIERDELIKSLSILVNDLKNNTDSNIQEKQKGHFGIQKDSEMLQNLLDNLPDYPLIGCLPTSVLDMEESAPYTLRKEVNFSLGQNFGDIEITLSECSNDSDIDVGDTGSTGELKVSSLDVSSGNSEYESLSEADGDDVQLRELGAGIVIRKKLRQKGISIIVGSSSSEGEEEILIVD